MARGIKRSLVRPNLNRPSGEGQTPEQDGVGDATPAAFKRATGGAGSAWKAGAVAQAQAGLDEAREKLSRDILSGDYVLEIDPSAISDPVGSDRRQGWENQEDFAALTQSIKDNGQDMPILVWPEDPNWAPDSIDPTNLERVQFLLLAGRRRTEAAKQLGTKVRAVIASQANRGAAQSVFEMLALRFRENEERQDLSAFERLVSIGEMYEALAKSTDTKIKAKEFAARINVHESLVSRARAVYENKDEILNVFKNVYEMSFAELQRVLSDVSETKPKAAPRKPKKIKVTRKVGSRNLALESVEGKLSIKASGMKLSQEQMEQLGDLIADYLNKDRSQ